jgi:hypothetical protein
LGNPRIADVERLASDRSEREEPDRSAAELETDNEHWGDLTAGAG